MAEGVYESSYISETDRQQAVDMLMRSQFANPPYASNINQAKLAKEIELLFYLQIVMDLDFTQTYYQPVLPNVARGHQKKPQPEYGPRVAIEEGPASKNYPKPIRNRDIIDHMGSLSGTNIGYDDLGRAFYDRINVLYVELFNTGPLLSAKTWDDWFNVDMNKEALLDAETGIVKLERSGMARFKETLNKGL